MNTFGASTLYGRQVLLEEEMELGTLSDVLADAELYLDFASVASMVQGIANACRFLHERTPPKMAALTSESVVVDARFVAKVRDGREWGTVRRHKPASSSFGESHAAVPSARTHCLCPSRPHLFALRRSASRSR